MRHSSAIQHNSSTSALALASIGVVFGDIGTSPLYALAAIFKFDKNLINQVAVFGAVSCIFWTLMSVVSFKYVSLILRADNQGEGGIFSMMSLATSVKNLKATTKGVIIFLGVLGASLFYGDSVITPAITILSSMEGLKLFGQELSLLVIPASLTIVIVLFLLQRLGTAIVGSSFGPIMIIWFLLIGINGLNNALDYPAIFNALNPFFAYRFIISHFGMFFVILGAIVLAVTGAEALYADMGHFGRKPIRLAWFFLVLPSLTFCYLGQGAILIQNPDSLSNLFFLSFPAPLFVIVFVITTLAAIIASQAVITGTFSLTQQAIQTGLLPRMKIVHTSLKERGQIYIPTVNTILGTAVVATILFFGSSDALAHAYGLSVTAAMAIDTILAYVVARYLWNFSRLIVVSVTIFLLFFDLSFLIACSLKLFEGGWFTLLLATSMAFIILTWKKGRGLVSDQLIKDTPTLQEIILSIDAHQSQYAIVDNVAVFMTHDEQVAPQALVYNLRHNKIIHRLNIILSVVTTTRPFEVGDDKIQFHKLSDNFYTVRVLAGFMERIKIPKILTRISTTYQLPIKISSVSYFLGKITVVKIRTKEMNFIRATIFRVMYFNSSSAVSYFSIPSEQVIELGVRISL
ncbi:MAG: KUP/HAK/KT family potassium transporter [Methylacidiphilales bacterium]|nr:KUP/HAK/KT family potassium transporter [Candidatus Methylacidiphilales bacterium]